MVLFDLGGIFDRLTGDAKAAAPATSPVVKWARFKGAAVAVAKRRYVW
jgi:hypothetical protein